MAGTGAAEKPVVLTLRGAVEKSFPYTVKIDGGPLSGLNSADQPWPFKLHLEFAGTALEVNGAIKDPLGTPPSTSPSAWVLKISPSWSVCCRPSFRPLARPA